MEIKRITKEIKIIETTETIIKTIQSDEYIHQQFQNVMKQIKENDYHLNHQEYPSQKPLEYTGLIDIYKFSVYSITRDIRCCKHLHHVRTNDKSSPRIPYIHKNFKSFNHQKLMDDIKKRSRSE